MSARPCRAIASIRKHLQCRTASSKRGRNGILRGEGAASETAGRRSSLVRALLQRATGTHSALRCFRSFWEALPWPRVPVVGADGSPSIGMCANPCEPKFRRSCLPTHPKWIASPKRSICLHRPWLTGAKVRQPTPSVPSKRPTNKSLLSSLGSPGSARACLGLTRRAQSFPILPRQKQLPFLGFRASLVARGPASTRPRAR